MINMRTLVIDDEAHIRKTTAMTLDALGHECVQAASSAEALQQMQKGSFDAAFLDLRLGHDDGLELIPKLLALEPKLAVIVFTAYSSIDTAVEAMRHGAVDYIAKPFTPEQIRQSLSRIENARRLENRVVELESMLSDSQALADFNSDEPSVQKLFETANKAAASAATLLILGESGTGKSVLARQMHRWSNRSREPFVTISCPSLSRELFESELFGHVKGAFTGAIANTWGKVAAADRGTLFLDEIGELPLEIQPKLLRLLQEHEYERVGDSKIYRADVRIIAATNRDLKKAAATGAFREDLLYRLDVMALRMPALRERAADIIPLAESHLRQIARKSGQPFAGIGDDARQLLQRYSWPGNIRELRNVMERATILSGGGEIHAAHLPTTLGTEAVNRPFLGGEYSLEEVEAEHIRQVLARAESLQDAAAVLKVDRKTLLRKRKELNLE